MAEMIPCARHPRVETGLRCTQCETPICPSCAVDAVVGMRCPSCAKPDALGGLRRRPEQLRRAGAVAVGLCLVAAAVLAVFRVYSPIGLLFLPGLATGMLVGRQVRDAASGNTVDVVRWLAYGGAVGAVVLAELVGVPLLGYVAAPSVWTPVDVAAAAFGVNRAMQ